MTPNTSQEQYLKDDGSQESLLLRAENITKHFPLKHALPFMPPKGVVRAVDGVSFDVAPQETLSLVGESGCGKTTTAKMILRLEAPTTGALTFYDEGVTRDVTTLRGEELKRYRSAVQSVFQDPRSSVNPRRRVYDVIAEPLVVISRIRGQRLRDRVEELLDAVGLESELSDSYPHSLSGGMLQRVAVARALALNPKLIVLDEPTSSLDVSIQAQIMNLLKDIQERFDVAYVLIAHNLATVRYLSHRVAVMYLGEIVESSPPGELFTEPLHPYTQALISAAVPALPGEADEEIVLSGEVPSPTNPPSGCRFHPRCPLAFDRCTTEPPELREVAPGRNVACHLY